ncbi:MAG TPA: histidine kinase dimerization/phospho-acceptor domain-containing protein [Croceibacterium sp.]|nr:histidine kinase dimerization/phospho-acceptor domain-containing protein [Croceibacterium sp.]
MLFDDRLATVLRYGARSEAGARTQYRQLLDLLGSMVPGTASALVDVAYARLGELAETLPSTVQSAILRAPGLRLRNPTLVAWLAVGDPQAAAAAMATAQLAERDWLDLIPRLPVTARGFLRHRRDLPPGARQVLERLGVRDLVLPEPDTIPPVAAADEPAEPDLQADAEASIGALVRRIEAFQRARREAGAAPRLPLGDMREPDAIVRSRGFDFASDAEGIVTWADPAMAPLIVGLTLAASGPGAVAQLDDYSTRALTRRLPVRGGTVQLAGPPEIAGPWRIDAAPLFADGHFAGYEGRLRRPSPAPRAAPAAIDGGDRMRQLLHELRTPVGAIQGFAELIQQQLYGPAPNEYRALAAAVAVDAARLLAAFDEIDRLAKLESGAAVLGEGICEWDEALGQILRRIDGALRPRSARIEAAVHGASFTVGLAETDAQLLAWRLLATLGGALAPGEVIDLALTSTAGELELVIDLPAALLDDADLFAASAPVQQRALSAGMFGSGFTLRLARAEARAAGGRLERRDDALRLVLPIWTGHAADKAVSERGGAAA